MVKGSATPAIVGSLLAGGVLVGLVLWGRSRADAQRQQMAKDDPTVTPVAAFPGLKVGDIVIVDTATAKLPAPFSSLQKLPAEVDMVLQDPNVVSVKLPPGGQRGMVPFFSGTISKDAILSVPKLLQV